MTWTNLVVGREHPLAVRLRVTDDLRDLRLQGTEFLVRSNGDEPCAEALPLGDICESFRQPVRELNSRPVPPVP